MLLYAAGLQESLTALHLHITEGSRGVLSAVARLLQLQKLEVVFYSKDDSEFTPSEMLSLRGLSQLRKVDIGSELEFSAEGLGDGECVQLMACWPHVRKFALYMPGGLLLTALGIVGQHCCQLRSLTMWSECTLCLFEDQALDLSKLLFSELRELRLSRTVGLNLSGLN